MIDTTIPVSEVNVDGVAMTLIGGSSGENKLVQVYNKTVKEITAKDLEGATKIPLYAFYYCENLAKITIPDSVTSIGQSAFYYCTGLTGELVIPDSVTSIGKDTFYSCISLTSATIGSGITSIGNAAFNGAYNIKEFTIKAITPPTLANTTAIPSNAKIYIPTGTLEAYSSATNWSSFASKFVEKEM